MADKLTIIIGAKDEFSKTFSKLRGSVPNLTKAMVGASAAIVGVGTAIFALTKQTANAFDSVRKFSDRIGIGTEELSKLQVAADFSSVRITALNMALQRMTRRVGEASMGTGIAKKALEDLGIPIEHISQLKPDEQFRTIAKALEGVENQGQKTALAMKFFDSEGVAVLQMLKNGVEGLDAMTAEAEKFGLVVTEKAANNAAQFNDSLTRLTGSFKGLRNTIAEDIFPVITALANKLANFVAENRTKIVESLKNVGSSVLNVFQNIALGTAGFIDSVNPMVQKIWENMRGLWDAFKSLPEWVQAIGVVGAFVGGKKGAVAIGAILHLLGVAKTSMRGFSEALEGNIKWTELATANHKELAAILENLDKRIFRGKIPVESIIDIDPSTSTLKGKLETIFAEIRETIANAGLGMGGGEGGGGISNLFDPVFDDEKVKNYYNNWKTTHQEFTDWLTEGLELDAERIATWREIDNELYQEYLDNQLSIKLHVEDQIRALEEKQRKDRQKARKQERKEEEKQNKLKVQAYTELQNNLFTISSAFGDKAFRLQQGLSIATAIMSAFEAANINLAKYAYPLGPILAATALAAGLANVATIASQKPSKAHMGLTNVPAEETYLLNRNERVLSPIQNRDLTQFLEDTEQAGGAGGTVNIDNLTLEILPNATNAEALFNMDQRELEELVEEKFIPAMRSLKSWGIRS